MNKILLLVFSLFCTSVFSQTLYKDRQFKEINRLTMTYSDTLKTDIYFQPDKTNTIKNPAPLILLVHGGGFAMGKRDGELEANFAMDMASRGYVVASMEYHLTRKGKKEGFGCRCPKAEKIETFRQAVINIDDALDYLLKFSREFGFDASKIILAGSSAGAEAVLHAAYGGNHPEFKGLIDADRKILAVISLAGALVSDVVLERSSVPAFMVHGTADELVPYSEAPHHFCSEEMPGYLMLQGSEAIAQDLQSNGTSYALHTAQEGGHEWANKGYELTDEISAFLHDLLTRGYAGQTATTIPSGN